MDREIVLELKALQENSGSQIWSPTGKAVPARRSASIKRHKQAGVTARRRGLLRRRMKGDDRTLADRRGIRNG